RHRGLPAGELPVFRQRVREQRLLEPGETVRREASGAVEDRIDVAPPGPSRVDHELRLGAESFARGADEVDVRVRPVLPHRSPSEFRGLEPALAESLRDAAGVVGRIAEEDGRVGGFREGLRSAEKAVDGGAETLSDEVPEGDIGARVSVVDLFDVAAV